MAGGRGLGKFRADFLGDTRVRTLVDYENARDAFPTVGIGGGICYFLWDRDSRGICNCIYVRNGEEIGPHPRQLNAYDIFVRDPRAVSILEKVTSKEQPAFETLVSGDTPFGLATNFRNFRQGERPQHEEILLRANVGTKRVFGAIDRKIIKKNEELIDKWKLFLPVAGSGRERERTGVDVVLGPPIIGDPGSVCTQTYLAAGPLRSEEEAKSVNSYLRTRFARFLISLRKPAQHVFRGMYRWVPLQRWDQTWTDEELFGIYKLNDNEVSFILSTIRTMELTVE